MLIEECIECPECKFPRALHHYGSLGYNDFIACPKCHFYSEFGKKIVIPEGTDEEFWKNVEKDAGFEI